MENNRNYKRPVSVLVVVYTLAGEVLMLRRTFPEDFWQSITGSLEWDEQPEQAARRELKEETGLEFDGLVDCHYAEDFEIYSSWRDRYAPGVMHNKEHVFVLPLKHRVEIAIDQHEHFEYQWVPREQAIQLATSYTNSNAILRWVPESSDSVV